MSKMEHSQIREQVRKMHQEMGILLSQMEAAQPVDGVKPDLTPYVMAIKDNAEAERALAAARKLGYPIDPSERWNKYRQLTTHFFAESRTTFEGSAFHSHSGIENRTPITLTDFEKLAGILTDLLEGKSVDGFYNNGLNYNEQHLWSPKCIVWGIYGAETPTPHHLHRVTERTVGKFYLIEGCSGDSPTQFALYLGDFYVKWSTSANAPIFTGIHLNTLSMYEVTPTL